MAMYDENYGTAPVIQDISRQRKMAEQLRAQSQEQLNGQMVSGHYVAPSWTQQLAKLVQSGTAGYMDNKANAAEKDYNATKAKKLAEFLQGNTPQTTHQGTTDTSVMPAYMPDQQDRFGSPLPNVQRQPVVTSTPNMVTETPEQMQARQRTTAYQLASEYGNDPSIQMALQDMNHARDRSEHQADVKDERTYQDGREERIYNRDRKDKLSDVEAEHKYQEIVMKEQQGFQLTMQDKLFAQQYKLQAQSQGFQAAQQAKSQQFQAGQNALSRAQSAEMEKLKLQTKQAPSGYIYKADGTLQAIKGGPADKSLNPTEVQTNANLFGSRANKANEILNKLEGQYSPNAIVAKNSSALSYVPLAQTALNYGLSDKTQMAEQAQRDFASAILRKESGAAISAGEYDNVRKQYFPQTGDSDAVIKQKAKNRMTAIEGIKAAAGPIGDGIKINNSSQPTTSGW